MITLSNRTSQFQASLIRKMTRISNACGAINLSQGFPDYDPPQFIMDRMAQVAYEGPHQYPITWGAPNFRQAVVDKQSHFMGRTLDPNENIVTTIGSTEAMVCSLMALCDPGDKVGLFSPYFENYVAEIEMLNAVPVYVPLTPPAFTFDPEQLEDAFRQGLKAFILCNPANPSGKVFTREELQILADLAIKYDVVVITDEVYEHIIYKPHAHIYLNSLPGMWERTISCSSMSKTYHITGWRLGYAIAPKYLMDRVKQCHDFVTVAAAAPLMEACIAGLRAPLSYYDELQARYEHMKALFVGGLRDLGFTYTEPEGAYYVMVDIAPFTKDDDLTFCQWMAEHVGVAAVPACTFFHEDIHNLIRFHFAKRDETLYDALNRLESLRSKVK